MKFLKIIITLIAINMIFFACEEEYLQKTPLDEVTAIDFFKSPDDLKVYLNQFYIDAIFPTYYHRHGNDFDSDNQVWETRIDSRLEGTRTVTTSGTINFTRVRDINYFFDNYKKVEEEYDLEDYQQYLGEAYFFRAVIYFDLLKSYGDIPWVTTEIGTTSADLYKPRDPRNFVADKIIESLDSAAIYLTDKKTHGAARVNKWMALLVQSRVALYEGTWEKYHNNTDFGVSNPQPEKYFNKVVQTTKAIMESGLYNIYSTGKQLSDYNDLFNLRDYSTNQEVLFWKQYILDLTRGSQEFYNERNYYMEYPRGRSITKQLADSYLCTDGMPISISPLFKGHETLNQEAQNRDPRFRATIATPDEVWKINENGTIQYWSEVMEQLNTSTNTSAPSGYTNFKAYDPRMMYHTITSEETPSIIYRYAEVLLNFAEAKAELGTITQDDIDISIKKLRDRIGLPNLILADIPVDPDWKFPDLSPAINEIRRERRVEMAIEGFRLDDILRWAAADELIVGTRPKGFKAAQLNNMMYPVDEDGLLDPFQNALPNGYGFKLDRDYLNSIPESEITLNPENLKQNPGWD